MSELENFSHSSMDRLLSFWKTDPEILQDTCSWVSQPQREAEHNNFPESLHPSLVSVLQEQGISRLYSHQHEAWRNIEENKNIVLTTGTASGKSLCYQLPILHTSISSDIPTTLMLFPTKALAQDQLESLNRFTVNLEKRFPEIPVVQASIFDGDTPTSSRKQIRGTARVLLTNPDMLHMAMLPHHTLWERLFSNIRFIVIDEIHIYRGVFGSNIINVLRRLKRICHFYGASPQFIMTSATIANPVEHAENLIEEKVFWINRNGAPHGERHFLMVNPPIIHPELGIRLNPAATSLRLTNDLLVNNQQTLIFLRTRRAVELLYKQLNAKFPDINIHSYRSGYLPAERRKIEKQLRTGETRVVVATNALELGIDIGGINAVLMVGYPGTVAATIQQAGRAGRKTDTAVAVLIASQNPLDQYLMSHPEFLLEKTPEQALCDPNNLLILLGHLRCAAFELPFQSDEHFGSAPDMLVQGLLMFLVKDNQLHKSGDSYFWAADQYPADGLNLRTSAGQVISLKVNDEGKTTTLGTVDAPSAIWMVHPDAIYLHQGESYLVRELDLELGQASLEPVSVDYFTEARNEVTIEYANPIQSEQDKQGSRYFGDIRVVNKVTGYKKIRWVTLETLGVQALDLPPNTLDTSGYWFSLSDEIVESLRKLESWSGDSIDYGTDWKNTRLYVLQRENYKCALCGTSGTSDTLHIHHKTPFRNFLSASEANQLWNLIPLCPRCHRRAEMVVRTRSGLSGLRYVLLNLAPLLVMCDPTDLGSLADPKADFADGKPAVLLYDQIPGGIGLSQALYQAHYNLLERSLELVNGCSCEEGCPGCVGPAGENGTGGKIETLTLLKAIVQNHG